MANTTWPAGDAARISHLIEKACGIQIQIASLQQVTSVVDRTESYADRIVFLIKEMEKGKLDPVEQSKYLAPPMIALGLSRRVANNSMKMEDANAIALKAYRAHVESDNDLVNAWASVVHPNFCAELTANEKTNIGNLLALSAKRPSAVVNNFGFGLRLYALLAHSKAQTHEAMIGSLAARAITTQNTDAFNVKAPTWHRSVNLLYSAVVDAIETEIGCDASHAQATLDKWIDVFTTPFLNSSTTTQDTTNEGVTAMSTTQVAKLPALPNTLVAMLDAGLKSTGYEIGINDIIAKANDAIDLSLRFKDAEKKWESERGDLEDRLRTLKNKAGGQVVNLPAVGSTIPNGKVVMVPADTVFPSLKGIISDKWEVPSMQWDAPHPDVPMVDDLYMFQNKSLIALLKCLATGQRNAWVYGHTGTGKTTLVEQVCARIGWPVMRIAMDSAVDRAELIGRMGLKAAGSGGTEDHWIAGVLEIGMTRGYTILVDEISASNPKSLYVMQELFERKPKRLMEDGGRLLNFHPMTRIVATDNTQGHGDSTGLYPVCRALTAATLDRFQTFIKVDYISQDAEKELLKKATGVDNKAATSIAKMAAELRRSFTEGVTRVSFSPRRSIAFACSYQENLDIGLDKIKAMALACETELINYADEDSKAKVMELAGAALGQGVIDPAAASI